MNDVTDLIVVLDRSGSMEDRKADHEGGLRSFVRDQRGLAGEVRLTFVRFDSHEPFEVVYDRTPLAEVVDERLLLLPRGGTPLLEAVSRTLAHVAERLLGEPPHPVIVMVVTDGHENSSGPEYTKSRVKAQVTAQEAAGWTVLYLGANVDEFAEAASLGIGSSHALGYAATKVGTGASYVTLSANTSHARATFSSFVGRGFSMGATPTPEEINALLTTTVRDSLAFTAEQRAESQADDTETETSPTTTS
jgi:hypothetical protein